MMKITLPSDLKKDKKEELETEYPDGIPLECDPDLRTNLSRYQVVFLTKCTSSRKVA